MMMTLGTVMFPVQVFAGKFQTPSSFMNPAAAMETSASGSGVSDADFLTTENGTSSSSDAAAHSMNRKTNDADGFLAAPWIPVSYIHQSANESSLIQQNPKYLSTYTVKEYPANKKNIVTDHTIRSLSNPDSRIQAFAFHVSKLTAG